VHLSRDITLRFFSIIYNKRGETIKLQIQYLVDAMSSFGAYQINASLVGIDFLVSSTNKNLQGIPGFTFIIAKKSSLDLMKG
jgi:aspartate aminotransferase-like enzyme